MKLSNYETRPNDQAFPSDGSGAGMTIREEFAKAAMQGILAAQLDDNGYSPVWAKDEDGKHVKDELGRFVAAISVEDIIARVAVKQADALIAALNAPETP